MKMRVADYIAQFIENYGVKDIFLLSGGGIMHLTDGLACNNKINVVCFHHEQAVSMAMDAYSRVSGHFSVGYFTTGPGATNAITGLAGAWLDSVPCLFISGQVKKNEAVFNSGIKGIRQFGVQEINIIPIIKTITKFSAMVNIPEDIKYYLEKAVFYAKFHRPGPVWLDIPLDVQGAIIETDNLRGYVPRINKTKITNIDYSKLTRYLKKSQRPVILAGQGVRISGSIEELLKCISTFNIPVVTSFLGIDIIDSKSPNYVGRIGLKGDRGGNLALQNSDLLIVIGSSLPVAEIGYEYNQFARSAVKVIVDIDSTAHKKNTIPIDLLLECDAKEFLVKMSQILSENQINFNKGWLDQCISWRERYPVCLPEYSTLKDRVNLYYFIDKLSHRLGNDDIVVTDAGSAFYAGAQAIQIKQGMRYITSGGLATMGFSIPASIGACVASNGHRVICVTGDGSFQLNIQELQTIIHHKYPIKMFIFNNEGYLSIKTTQRRYFENRLIGEGCDSGVSFPQLDKIAHAYGIPFFRINNNEELDSILVNVLTCEGPIICEVMTPVDQEIIPTIASEKREDGSMVSKPLEDMYPFLDRKEFLSNMYIKPLNE
jgi:acetolactate synthase I/II/III large subunit